jgi:pimeloyl-ACP methyl ester carboxylesterase
MPADVALLESHSSFLNQDAGIEERFLRLRAGPAGTVGVLRRPIAAGRRFGWLICHSFGVEQMYLARSEVVLARRLAAAGYPVVTFHAQGYGDSDLVEMEPLFSTHVRDAADVAEQIRELADVDEIGLIGAKFGSAVAAAVASTEQILALVLIAPVLDGGRYVRALLRSQTFVDMAVANESENPQLAALESTLQTAGVVHIRGVPVGREMIDEMSRIDLRHGLSGLEGNEVLLVQVSRSDRAERSLEQFAEVQRSRRSLVELRTLAHPSAPMFGSGHFRPVAEDRLGDVMEELNEHLADLVVAWAARREEHR